MVKYILYIVVVLVVVVILLVCVGKVEYYLVDQLGLQLLLFKLVNFLMLLMQVFKGVGWVDGQVFMVVEGLKIECIVVNLQYLCWLLILFNGDVLVVEGNGFGEELVIIFKQWIVGKVKVCLGKVGKGGNWVILLCCLLGMNIWIQYVYIEGLYLLFGIQLIGDMLYVVNIGNIMQYYYVFGEICMFDKGCEFIDLFSIINYYWIKELLVSCDGCKLYVGVGFNSNIIENGLVVEYC